MKANILKDSEVGRIPIDWEVCKLGDRAIIARGGSPRPIEDYLTNDVDGINWIKIGDVAPNAKYINTTHEKIKPSGELLSRKVHKGDFLLSNSMSFGRPYILNVDGCIHDGWLVIQDYQKTFDKDFLYYLLGSNIVVKQYKSQAAGSSVLNLNKEIVKGITVVIPNINEQKRIARLLSEIDAFIAKQTDRIEKKRLIKEGLMQDLLTGKKRIPGFSEKWIYKKLGECAQIKARIGWQGLTTDEYLSSGDYYLITGTEIENGKVSWEKCYYVSEERYLQDKYIQVQSGDVLISKDGTIGKVAYIDTISGKATLNSGVFVIRSKEKCLTQEYMAYVFLSRYFNDFIDKIVAGSTITHLYQKDIVYFSFPIPPSVEEQTAIAQIIRSINEEINLLESQRDKYILIKQGMMQEFLTGRIRL